YREAVAARPALADALPAGHRYDAACAAARAGAVPEREEAADFRRQALAWLREDLAAWRRLADDPARTHAQARFYLRLWQRTADLAGLRDAAGLARLPAAERDACRRLWADVAVLLARLQAPGQAEK